MTFSPILIGTGFSGFQQLKSTEDAQRAALTQNGEIARETSYARESLGRIATSDQLLADRRLLEVALTAYGLEDQIDNAPIIKRVLDEGTEDDNAYANLLNDSRWVTFSEEMGFGDSSGASDLEGFSAIVQNRIRNARVEDEPTLDPSDLAQFRRAINDINSIDELLADPVTLDVALQAFGLERGYYTDAHFRQLLTEGVDDEDNDYAYTLENEAWVSFATAFSGLGDGQPLETVTSFRLDVERELERRNISLFTVEQAANSTTRISTADLDHFKATADSVASAADLVNNAQLRKTTLAAYGLAGTTLSDGEIVALLDGAVAGDFSLAEAQTDSAWKQLASSFAESVNAGASGEVPHFAYAVELGIANEALEPLSFLEEEDNSVSDVRDDDLAYFVATIETIDGVDDFLADERLLQVGLSAFGLQDEGKSTSYLRDVLTTDASDDAAFVNGLRDTRWADFAKAFQGIGADQALWQSEIEQRLIANEAPEEDLAYLRRNWKRIDEGLDLVLFPELRDIALSAFGVPKGTHSGEFFTSMIISDPNDPNSFVNLYNDDNWKAVVELMGSAAGQRTSLQDDDFVESLIDRYENKRFEIAVGEQDQTMRLALNFERVIGDFSSRDNWFALLADQPLRTVLDAVFSAPEGFVQQDLEDQAAWYERSARQLFGDATPAVFADPQNTQEALRRYLASVDTASTGGINATTPGYNALGLMTNAATNARTGFGRF